MEQLTDSELVAQVRAGQKSAFGPLIERYQPMVRHITMGMVSNDEIARELAQYEAVTARVKEMTAFVRPTAPTTAEERQENYRKFVEFMTEDIKI